MPSDKSYFLDVFPVFLNSLPLVPFSLPKILSVGDNTSYEELQSWAEQNNDLYCRGCGLLYLLIPACSAFITVWLHQGMLPLQSATPRIFLWRAVAEQSEQFSPTSLCTVSCSCVPVVTILLAVLNFKACLQMMKQSHIILSSGVIAFPPDLCATNFNKHVLYFFLSFTNVSGEQNQEQGKKRRNLLDISFCFYSVPLLTPMGVLHLLLVSSRLCFLGCLWEHLWMAASKEVWLYMK